MLSPETLPTVIEKVDQWTKEELSKNINYILPILTSSLKKVQQKSLCLRCVHILLDRCLQCVPFSEVDSSILKYALPTVQRMFNEALEGINVVLQDADNLSDEEVELTIKSLHHVCFGLLDQLNKVLVAISSFCPSSAMKVASVPCTVLQILQTAFVHCRESEEMYGIGQEYLMGLFRNSEILLTYLEPLLISGLQFSLNSEEEESLFKNVMESLKCLAKATTCLGIRVQTITWRTYVTLVERYSEFRDFWTSYDIYPPLEVLTNSIYDVFMQLLNTQQTDIKLGIKVLAVLSFLVRVLTKLCNAFVGHFTDTCMSSLFRLLNILYRNCVFGRGKENSLIMMETERRIGVAATSLISCLINDRSFVQFFILQTYSSTLEPGSNSDSSLGWLLMGVGLCQALVSCDSEIRKPWISNPESHIVIYIFRCLGYCHVELSSNEKYIAANIPGKAMRYIDLYEHVLTPVGALVLLVPAENFGFLEVLLMNNITEIDPWRSLFALDLWCIIARQSPIGVRMNHATFILQLLSTQQSVQCSPRQIHLRILLARLWSLLSVPQQAILLNKFPPMLMPDIWNGVSFEKVHENVFPVDLFCNTAQVVDSFLINPGVETFKEMIKHMKSSSLLLSLDNLSSNNEDKLCQLASSLCTLWSLFDASVMGFADESWLSYFLSVLCDLTAKLCSILNNSQLIEILKKASKIVNNNSSHLKLKALTVVYALAEKVFDSDSQQQCVFQNVVNVLLTLLQDENVFVQQESFKVFEYFAHVTIHEYIVKNCVKHDKSIQDQVALYLKRSPIAPENDNLVYNDYLKIQSQVKFVHECKIKKMKSSSTNDVSVKQFPVHSNSILESGDDLSENVMNIIQRLLEDAENLLQDCRTKQFSNCVKTILLAELEKVRKSVDEVGLLLKE